jgi:predicted short-subunit dehydrogenase-like oxidoreductase (DUF2520 family)
MTRWEERVGLIGSGRLGTSLAAALLDAGIPTLTVDPRVDRAWQQTIDGCTAVFLTVADRDVRPLADSIPWRSGQAAIHCSGALGLDVLTAVRTVGGLAGCLHPLQSFPSRTAEPRRFAGTWCGVEGEGGLQEELEALAEKLGMHPFSLLAVNRVLYHAAAVTMNNLVVGLAAVAGQMWEAAGLPSESAREALSPLLTAAADNIAALPLDKALTGPLARGDVSTVRAHLEALERMPQLHEVYRRLALQLLAVAPKLNEAQLRELTAVLNAGAPRRSPSP